MREPDYIGPIFCIAAVCMIIYHGGLWFILLCAGIYYVDKMRKRERENYHWSDVLNADDDEADFPQTTIDLKVN